MELINPEVNRCMFEGLEKLQAGGGTNEEEIREYMTKLMTLMREMDHQMIELRSDVGASLQLNIMIEAKLNKFPPTFVIMPKLSRKLLDEHRSVVAKGFNFARRWVIDPFCNSLWQKCVLYFVCPVTRKIVPCGRKGKGYKLSVPTLLLRTIAPALKWGFLFLKIALASQGLGAVVPDISEFVRNVNDKVQVNSLMQEFTSQLEDVAMSSVEQCEADLSTCLDAVLPSSINEVFRLVYKEEQGDQQMFSEWTPENTGLHKVTCSDGSGSAWVSAEAVGAYEAR